MHAANGEHVHSVCERSSHQLWNARGCYARPEFPMAFTDQLRSRLHKWRRVLGNPPDIGAGALGADLFTNFRRPIRETFLRDHVRSFRSCMGVSTVPLFAERRTFAIMPAMNDPRDARNARQLPNAAVWVIVCHPTMPAPELARFIGCDVNTIRNRRLRIRRHGWFCRVAYVPCAACGEPVTLGAICGGVVPITRAAGHRRSRRYRAHWTVRSGNVPTCTSETGCSISGGRMTSTFRRSRARRPHNPAHAGRQRMTRS
jgi:hypothetical protein